jgi:hypothetical protein
MLGEEKGYRHEVVTQAMVTIARLGRETGLWDTVILGRWRLSVGRSARATINGRRPSGSRSATAS